ncbi:unnamed protein product [Ectocarpus sp. CCAP 1310/34]|nr:unnamed protein product [Ectocarpus sp. CCAP 1310/34]
MSDLPNWAKGEGEEPKADLADKLVDEAAGVKPEESADAAAAAATDPAAAGSNHAHEDSGLASRALCFFRFLAVLTVVLALVVIGTNCYIIYDKYTEIKARGILLRVYGILFSIFIIFAELEWSKFTKFFGFLKYWPARGLFYIFVGLITWDQTDATSSSSYGTYEDIVSFLMMSVGGIYFLLGLACMRTVKEAERARLADESA